MYQAQCWAPVTQRPKGDFYLKRPGPGTKEVLNKCLLNNRQNKQQTIYVLFRGSHKVKGSRGKPPSTLGEVGQESQGTDILRSQI